MAKPKASDAARPGTDAAYLGSVLGLIDSAGPDVAALQALLDARPIDARELLELVAALRIGYESSRQRQVAEKRYRTRHMAMRYVADLWVLRDRYYSETVKAFSERAADDVWTKFKVKVKPKTIESGWLTPALIEAAKLDKDLPSTMGAVAFADGRKHYLKERKSRRSTIKVPDGKN